MRKKIKRSFVYISCLFILGGLDLRAQAATLIHTNDVMGDLEPCGCRSNPQGGMARKFNFVKRVRENKDPSVIQVDSGDLLFASSTIPPMLRNQAELQAQYLLKSMDLMKHDVVVPGEKDFALGLKIFEKLIKKSQIRFLAANLKRRNGKAFLDSHVILSSEDRNHKKIKIGIIGLVGESLRWPKELQVTSVINTARAEVSQLKNKVDKIIAVTHQGLEADKKLALSVPGIDIIIGGHSQSFLQVPVQVRSTLIFQSSFRNQYVGEFPLDHSLRAEKYQLVGLDAGYESPVESQSEMDILVSEFKKAISELNERQDQILANSTRDSHSSEGNEYFHTFPKCAGCHLKQFDFWRKTNHAHALEPLIQKKQEKNKECLSCHTVGLGHSKGFQNVSSLAEYTDQDKTYPLSTLDFSHYLESIQKAKNLNEPAKLSEKEKAPQPISATVHTFVRAWAPVQCENCHLPGRGHPFSGQYTKKVEKNVCLNCHTAERAPQWYTSEGKPDWKVIDAKRSLITCPAGDLSVLEE